MHKKIDLNMDASLSESNKPLRLDVSIVKRGFVESREKAKFLIKTGNVLVDNVVILKPSKSIRETAKIQLKEGFEYVGRGSYKIDAPAQKFNINFDEKIISDVGCSTGGFTHYALKHGAKKVYAIDVGDTLHDFLKREEKVIYLPDTDFRKIKGFPEKIDLCLIDVTFIPLEEALGTVKDWLKPNGEVLGLIKPPFEQEGKLKKITNYEDCLAIAKKVADWSAENGYSVKGLMPTELKGKSAGQQEFFIYLARKATEFR